MRPAERAVGNPKRGGFLPRIGNSAACRRSYLPHTALPEHSVQRILPSIIRVFLHRLPRGRRCLHPSTLRLSPPLKQLGAIGILQRCWLSDPQERSRSVFVTISATGSGSETHGSTACPSHPPPLPLSACKNGVTGCSRFPPPPRAQPRSQSPRQRVGRRTRTQSSKLSSTLATTPVRNSRDSTGTVADTRRPLRSRFSKRSDGSSRRSLSAWSCCIWTRRW